MKKRICLLIPDGVGIRNYLYTDVLKYIKEAGHEVVVWHSLSDEVIKTAEQLHGISIEVHKFESFPDPFLIRLYREASTYARLQINAKTKNNETLLTNWNTKRNTLGKKLLYPLAEQLGKRLKSYKSVETLEKKIYKLQRKSKAFKTYKAQINVMNLDVLFCTHQRVPYVVSAILAAQGLGIKTSTAIFSWDNLPKARLPFRANQYLVWSDYMREELLSYYPDIQEKSVFVTSTPQFDFYRDEKVLQTREAFAKQYGLDATKKWVLFSGDDIKTSPYDANYLADLAEALQNEAEVQILFRQAPAETSTRYQAVLDRYPSVHHIAPEWTHGENWGEFYPRYSDVVLLVNLAKHCAAVVNVGSTMALDFSNFNTPGLYIRYNQADSINWDIDVIYQFQHFRSMDGLDPVGWINNKEEIEDKVMLAIEWPEKIGIDRKRWFERIVQPHPKHSAAQKIVDALTYF